jgi:hypothetical protein
MVKISSLLIKWKQAASGQHLPKLLSHLTFFVFVFAASTRMKKHITNTRLKIERSMTKLISQWMRHSTRSINTDDNANTEHQNHLAIMEIKHSVSQRMKLNSDLCATMKITCRQCRLWSEAQSAHPHWR